MRQIVAGDLFLSQTHNIYFEVTERVGCVWRGIWKWKPDDPSLFGGTVGEEGLHERRLWRRCS